MQVSFYTTSSNAQPRDTTTKEIAKAVSAAVPGAQVSVAKVNNSVLGFFSNVEREELTPAALLGLVKKMAPEGVVADWNFKKAPEEVLKQYFLTPAPQNGAIRLKGFEHLTPSFMNDLAEAQPNLRKIDLRKTKGTAKLLDSYLARQQTILSESNREMQRELREKMASRGELEQSQSDLAFKIENLGEEQKNLAKEIEALKELAQKAYAAANESPILEPYGKSLDQKAAALSDKLSLAKEAFAKETDAFASLTARIQSLNGAIDDLRGRFLDLDSVTVEVLVEGSDMTLEEKRELHTKYPHVALIAEDTTLDLSCSSLSLRQIWDKLKRLPQGKEVNLSGHQEEIDLFGLIDLEAKFGVKVLYVPPLFLAPAKKISIDGVFKPLSTELLSKVLRRFPEVRTVNLSNWKEATPLDVLCLEVTFPNIQFSFPSQERCELPFFEAEVIERLAVRFPELVIQLKDTIVEDEKQILLLADHFPGVDFQSESRLEQILQDVELCKSSLKRALRKNVKTILSIEELRSFAIHRPNLAPLIGRVIEFREENVLTGITSIQKEIEKIDFKFSLGIGKFSYSKEKIPYAFWMLIGQFSSDVNSQISRGSTPLMLAAGEGCLDGARLLIEKGADVNRKVGGWIPLNRAIEKGHIDVARLLIEKGAWVHLTDSYGCTPLDMAVEGGQVDMARLLIEKGADVTDRYSLGVMNPFMRAVKGGHIDVVRLLIEKGADMNQNSCGWTPLMLAVDKGYGGIVDLLIEKGANVNQKGLRNANLFWHVGVWNHISDGSTPLMLAASGGHVDMARLFINKGADVNQKNSEGSTPLMLAADKGCVGVLELLIEKGADVNQGSYSSNLLMQAASRGHIDLARFLIEKGADVNHQDSRGSTPLMKAASRGDIDVARLLIEKGADVNRKDSKGSTPLSMALQGGRDHVFSFGSTPLLEAAGRGHMDVAILLIEKGANVNDQDSDGWAPLMHAASGGRVDMVRFLIEKDADMNQTSSAASTPLMEAASGGHVDVAILLIEKGANVNDQDSRGWTPLMHAASRGRVDMVRFLMERGVNVNHQSSVGSTALLEAAGRRHMEVARLLIEKSAEVNHQDSKGKTSLMRAAEVRFSRSSRIGDINMARLLIEKSADVNRQDSSGNTALSYVKNNPDLEELLKKHGAKK